MDWFDDELKPLQSISVPEFHSLIEAINAQNDVLDALELKLKDEKKKLESLQGKVSAYLKEMNAANYSSPYGTVYFQKIFNFKLPNDKPDEKKKLFEYLKEQGLFEDLATINHNTFNSFCKKHLEVALQEGREFDLPGVEMPVMTEVLRFRKKRD